MPADPESVWGPDAVYEVQPTDGEGARWSPENPAEPEESSPRSSRSLVIGLGIVGALALVAIVFTSVRDAADDAAPAIEPTETDVAEAPPAETRAEQTAALLAALPTAADHLMFFRTTGSLALVDFRDGSSTLMDWSVPDQVDTVGFLYMASERGSWVIDPADLSVALRLAPTAQIAVLETPTRTAVLAEAAGATTVLGGFFDGRSIRILASVPVGSEAEAVQGLGVVVSPISGGSYLIQESLPVQVSEGRIVAPNANHYGEVLCGDRLVCTANIRSWHDDTLSPVPVDLLTAPVVRISPDGRWVLTGGGDRWSIYDVDAGTFTSTDADVTLNGSVAWAPDSSFFVWIEARTLFAAAPTQLDVAVTLALDVEPIPGLLSSEIGFLPVGDVE